jgi:ferredoxin-fold anticodon binding domain-containing protein
MANREDLNIKYRVTATTEDLNINITYEVIAIRENLNIKRDCKAMASR